MAVWHTRNVLAQVRFLVDAFSAQTVARQTFIDNSVSQLGAEVLAAACLALNEVGRGSSPRGPILRACGVVETR